MITVDKLTLGFFQSNCYIVWDDPLPECVIIDPGEETKRIIAVVGIHQLKPVAILLTHGHIDHCAGVEDLIKEYNIPFYLHKEEVPIYLSIPEQGMWFGIFYKKPPEPKNFLKNEEELSFGEMKFKALHLPGHSPGHLCYLLNDLLFTGDLLFNGTIGRTDLPGGSSEKIFESLGKLKSLSPSIRIYPGHGENSFLGFEFEKNPFLSMRF